MNIIICGLGAVGSAIMEDLAAEGHNVVVIDLDSKKVEDAVNAYDVKGVIGNGASSDVLKEAGVRTADLLIGATSTDEINILCCIIGNKLGVEKTIARASKPEYTELFQNEGDLGVSLMVNPQYEAAMEICRMLRFPSAIKVNQFSEGRVELVEFRVPADSSLVGISLKNLSKAFTAKVLICAAKREGKAMIPTGDFVIQPEDRLFLTATTENIASFFRQLGWNRQARTAVVVGGSTTAFYLCQQLERLGVRVKLIERDPQKATELADALKKTKVLLGDGTDQQLLASEGIADADAFVALSNLDEQNIIMSMFASSMNIPKVITRIDRSSYYDMLQKSGIYSAVSTKTSTADEIIRFVRTLNNEERDSVKRVFHIIDDEGEVIEFEATPSFKRFDVPISQLHLKKDLLIAGIVRKGKLVTPSGQDVIKPDDNVIIVTLEEGLSTLRDILED